MRNITTTIIYLIILGLILYVVALVFIEMLETLWKLSPLTSIGFIVSVGIAIWKGKLTLSKGVNNLRILLFIFVGTVVSYSATTLLPALKDTLFSGEWISAIIMGIVILIIWLRGREIKDWS